MPFSAERIRSRHPFELFFLYVVIFSAVVGLVTPVVRPGSIQEGIGPVGTYVWYGALLAGGLVAMLGIFWRDRATGLVMEALGLFTSGVATLFYGAAALVILGGVVAYPASSLFGYGAAAIWRSVQIRNFLVRVTKELSVQNRE